MLERFAEQSANTACALTREQAWQHAAFLRHVHAAMRSLPRRQRRAGDPALAAKVSGLHPTLLLTQDRDDLLSLNLVLFLSVSP
jgi:hypothetical protein